MVHRPIGWVCYLPVTCPAYAGLNLFRVSFITYSAALPIALQKGLCCSQYAVQQTHLFNFCIGAIVEKKIKKLLPATAKNVSVSPILKILRMLVSLIFIPLKTY